MSSYLTKIIESTSSLQKLISAMSESGVVKISGLVEPLYPAVVDAITRQLKSRAVIVVPEKLFDSTAANCKTVFGENALPFLSWDILPYAHKYPNEELVAQRIFSLWQFINTENSILITTPQALMWRTLPADFIEKYSLTIDRNENISQDKLLKKLADAGYRRERIVEFLRSFARRGEIIDFFSPAHSDPVRIEYFGDNIEEIRTFSTRDQRSITKIKQAKILPAVEWLTMEEPSVDELLAHISEDAKKILPKRELEELTARIALDRHFPGEIWFSPLFEPSTISPLDLLKEYSPIVIAVEPEKIVDEAQEFLNRANDLYERVSWEDFSPLPPEYIFPNINRFEKIFEQGRGIARNSQFEKVIQIREIPVGEDAIDFESKRVILKSEPSELLKQIEFFAQRGSIFVAISSSRQRERIEKYFGGKIPVPVRPGAVSTSFSLKQADTVVISGDDILGFSRTMFVSQRYHQGRAMLAHYGLEQGDFVVHSDYGIAKFLGIKQLEIDGRTTELLQLQFSSDEKLYVPMEDFYLVSPYLGPRSAARLSKLGGKKWSSIKGRARKKVFELAGELVRIYAMRQIKKRPPMHRADEWEIELQKTFPFDETPDQKKAIKDVSADLEKEYPMDRLLCGDVGFGKTEVALRAAVRAVSQGYQVALLVPTTILAEQHYATFRERLQNMPIRIEMLCRFTPKKKVSQIAQDIEADKIDIAIGTHMLLSDKIHFRKLGLLIVDEEQWFGVKHKEKLKSLRAEVDVLTMTATPIPRTLYFSISGLRDLSVIETPPVSQRPVFTQIVPWNIELFKKAIYQEIERGGQIFFVHNRVETIGGIEAVLKAEMPDLKIAVAHGQMPERKLERTVLDFRDGKYDMLLSTTIIESGTDISNVNTIIINRADKFGLSQLYQLRGRVGRADVQAYAYLVIPPYRSMTPTARKRLRAIMEHTELGSGYHLAMEDMEIRGAGNLLGKEQSGFVDEIGLDLYTKMLAEAVAELRGQKPPMFEPIPFKIDFDAYLPYDYIPETENRLWAYQRLFTADKEEKIARIKEELQDRFGRLPDTAKNLVDFLTVRILATQIGFKYVSFGKKWITLSFDTEKLSLAKLDEKLSKYSPTPNLVLKPTPKLQIPRTNDIDHDIEIILRMFQRFTKPSA